MKIISWNVNGIRACVKKGLREYLQKEDPDVFLVQETKAFRDQCRDMHLENTGLHDYWNSAKRPGYSGVAAFSKSALELEGGMGDELIDREGRLQKIDCKDFWLINTYFPNGAASDERHHFKMRFLDLILKYLKKLDKKKPLILTGDLNIAHTELDIHDPVRLDGTSGFKPEEREWMDRLMDAGFVDAYRHFHPKKEDQYTWWSYRAASRQRNKGWRIDYFVVSERLAKSLKTINLHQKITGSDHCPLSLEIS